MGEPVQLGSLDSEKWFEIKGCEFHSCLLCLEVTHCERQRGDMMGPQSYRDRVKGFQVKFESREHYES